MSSGFVCVTTVRAIRIVRKVIREAVSIESPETSSKPVQPTALFSRTERVVRIFNYRFIMNETIT